MAQQNKKNVKKAPSYSADNMMLRMAGGVGLIALGVLAFLAVALDMDGEVFGGLRQVSSSTCFRFSAWASAWALLCSPAAIGA